MDLQFDFSNLIWDEVEKKYRARYIDKTEDHNISYLELCNYVDWLQEQGLGKKKCLEWIKKKFR